MTGALAHSAAPTASPRGLRGGALLSAQFPLSPAVRRDQLRRLHAFADAFREINRRVCIEANSAYHFGKLPSS